MTPSSVKDMEPQLEISKRRWMTTWNPMASTSSSAVQPSERRTLRWGKNSWFTPDNMLLMLLAEKDDLPETNIFAPEILVPLPRCFHVWDIYRILSYTFTINLSQMWPNVGKYSHTWILWVWVSACFQGSYDRFSGWWSYSKFRLLDWWGFVPLLGSLEFQNGKCTND